jgi:putative transposase
LAPKYRYKIFYNKRVKKDCESIIKDICAEKSYRIYAMEVVDHCTFSGIPSKYLTIQGNSTLKIGSSYRLFKLHPELREKYLGGSLWSSGKFYRSIGNVTADTIKHYINDSQGKPKKEFRSSRIKKSGQLKLSDF